VDTAVILEEPKWNFLFEDALNFTIPEQPILVEASSSASSAVKV
jgi:hypothetical protein